MTSSSGHERSESAAIRAIREGSGISGRKLSAQLGMSHGTVSHWETGRRVPTVEDVADHWAAINDEAGYGIPADLMDWSATFMAHLPPTAE